MFLLVLTNYIVAVALFDVVFSVVKLPSCSYIQQISCFFWDDTFNLLLDTGLTLDAHLGGSLGGASFLPTHFSMACVLLNRSVCQEEEEKEEDLVGGGKLSISR